ncbi:LysR family transcriptional regulator [Edaphobacter albus]|uniref:LysR family transcriptional regulator n=1 Tax=Edaphobacter sp. 4G125 TaxID=2763071 RepID=UPI0016454EC9|nr:LysR family transcriptional regulator [Edaphobacter sp. 4G125]QNI36129.1 LysR family transcriptional regulator [Edaphobacter sp. 4G125]
MRINLDLDTLRTLCVAHDLGSLAQAAERLGRTPSAISLQMKRLQEELGAPLFRKRGRGLALTEAGEVALSYARRILSLNDELMDTMQGAKMAGHIRIGCPQDFAAILPPVLSHFSSLYPLMQIELRIEGNAALADAIEKTEIDLAVVIGHEDRAAASVVGKLDVVWIASSTFVRPRDQPLPLAVLGPQCVFRKCAIQHLEATDIPYRIAANSPSLDGLWAALLGGLGITARTGLNLPDGLVSAGSLYGLPLLEGMPVTLHRNVRSDGVAVDRMRTLLVDALGLALASRAKASRVTDISTRRRKSINSAQQ